MTEAVKARLFEAFFTTKPVGKGTGLGLATCNTIVQLSGGFIEVQTELGKGTTFEVSFPRIERVKEKAVKLTHVWPLPGGTEAVLVVEDEPSVRHLACKILRERGYEVLSAANGHEGLLAVRAHRGSPLRLVVTDVIMPEMSGRVMAEWLKTIHPDLSILFTTGYTDDLIFQNGMMEAGVELLPKPYTPATLLHKVREMLDGEDSRGKPELAAAD
jgi:CheY-like chemotaxis protein